MIVIDRILNGKAVCIINGNSLDIPLSKINGNAHEGDVLTTDENGRYKVDNTETAQRKKNISDRFNRIKDRNKK